eukprot:5303912-Alexandrium_andersonii.AAC.1
MAQWAIRVVYIPPEDKWAVATQLAELPVLRTAGHVVGDFNIVLDGPRDALEAEVAPAIRAAIEQRGLLRMEVPETHFTGGRGAAIDVAAVCQAWVAGWHQPVVRTTP